MLFAICLLFSSDREWFRTKAKKPLSDSVPRAVDWLATLALGHGVWLAGRWLTEVEIPSQAKTFNHNVAITPCLVRCEQRHLIGFMLPSHLELLSCEGMFQETPQP